MPSHTNAHAGSRRLCDQLFMALQSKIPDLRSARAKDTCGFYQPEHNRFAYAYHRIDSPHVRVYFRGKASAPPVDSTGTIDIHKRPKVEKGWDKELPYFLNIVRQSQVEPAAQVLITFAHPLANRRKRGKSTDVASTDMALPEELPNSATLPEGVKKTIEVNVFERNPTARKRCVRHYGAKCTICGFDFGLVYGPRGKGFIHVHHLVPMSQIEADYRVNPITDLRPVCPNCHAMIHRNPKQVSTCEEISKLLNKDA